MDNCQGIDRLMAGKAANVQTPGTGFPAIAATVFL